MHPLHAALLGLVEGVTEYLPISSTGHLILASRLLGLKGEGADSFAIVIQLGAILAVLVHYRRLLFERASGLTKREPASVSLLVALVLGFLPTVVVGLTVNAVTKMLLQKSFKELLFRPETVAFALVAGGLVMIAVAIPRAKERTAGLEGLEHVTPKRAFLIGLGQCVALWPGSSRSMCTIVAGQLTGLSASTAAEFSFLLGLPTLGAATIYDGYKSRDALAAIGVANVAIGLVVSFLVAWAVIAAFLAYLKRRGLVPFGVYRIFLGVVVGLVLLEA